MPKLCRSTILAASPSPAETDGERTPFNQRLWDLLRYARYYLWSEAHLISDEEYTELLAGEHSEGAVARLEDYDRLREREEKLREALTKCKDWMIRSGMTHYYRSCTATGCLCGLNDAKQAALAALASANKETK
jgi:hypothetical protein